jgi:hypothetical protein
MIYETNHSESPEAPWQPVAVVSLDKAPTKPPKRRWRSSLAGVTAVCLVWGAQDLLVAHRYLKLTDPPVRSDADYALSYAKTGGGFLVVGSVLLGCLLGLWIADRSAKT